MGRAHPPSGDDCLGGHPGPCWCSFVTSFLFCVITGLTGSAPAPPQVSNQKYATMSSDDKGSAAAPKRVESDVYDRQIRLWGADAQVSVVRWFVSMC